MDYKPAQSSMNNWTAGIFTADRFELEKGGELPEAELAYIHTGELAPDGRNAILVTHGYTTGHHFVLPESLAAEGSWSELIGPGRPIDTDRFFVISTNALGSCYGSSGPASKNPARDRPYGERFPSVTLTDTVRLQRMLLESLGVTHLHAVAGPSMGGMQAFLWGTHFPGSVGRLVIAVAGIEPPIRGIGDQNSLAEWLRAEPGWNKGVPEPGAMVPRLAQLRQSTLREYSMDDYLRAQGLSPGQVEIRLRDLSLQWATGFHPWSLVTLGRAIREYDVVSQLHRIRSRVLLALCANDRLYPAAHGPETIRLLQAAGVEAKYIEIPSRYGHLASGTDWHLWGHHLSEFMAS